MRERTSALLWRHFREGEHGCTQICTTNPKILCFLERIFRLMKTLRDSSRLHLFVVNWGRTLLRRLPLADLVSHVRGKRSLNPAFGRNPSAGGRHCRTLRRGQNRRKGGAPSSRRAFSPTAGSMPPG